MVWSRTLGGQSRELLEGVLAHTSQREERLLYSSIYLKIIHPFLLPAGGGLRKMPLFGEILCQTTRIFQNASAEQSTEGFQYEKGQG